jgi:hypothetical protein
MASASISSSRYVTTSPILIMPCAVTAYPLGRPQLWFERTLDRESNGYDWSFGKNFRGKRAERKVWQEFPRPNALFLSTAIQLNSEQLKPAFDWIAQGLIVAVNRTALNPVLTLELMQSDSGRRTACRSRSPRAGDDGRFYRPRLARTERGLERRGQDLGQGLRDRDVAIAGELNGSVLVAAQDRTAASMGVSIACLASVSTSGDRR